MQLKNSKSQDSSNYFPASHVKYNIKLVISLQLYMKHVLILCELGKAISYLCASDPLLGATPNLAGTLRG